MTWDPASPTNATKINQTPSILQGNWNAIEQGVVPYDSLRLEEQAGDPSRVDDRGFLYSKQVGSYSELYYLNDNNAADVVQLTQEGLLGGTTTSLRTDGITYDGTFTNVQKGFISGWAECDGTGGFVNTSYNLASCTRTGTGLYTIVTDALFANNDVAILLTPKRPGSNTPASANWILKTYAASIVTITLEVKNRGGSHIDNDFDIMMIGGL